MKAGVKEKRISNHAGKFSFELDFTQLECFDCSSIAGLIPLGTNKEKCFVFCCAKTHPIGIVYRECSTLDEFWIDIKHIVNR